jgi:hypothetical protein
MGAVMDKIENLKIIIKNNPFKIFIFLSVVGYGGHELYYRSITVDSSITVGCPNKCSGHYNNHHRVNSSGNCVPC